MKSAIELIADERKRQIEVEGWTPEHDYHHYMGELAAAAGIYALPYDLRAPFNNFTGTPLNWPWDPKWYKPTPGDRVRELVKAGALIIAEIERLQKL